MTDQVNGNARAGEFLTGNMDFFTVVTVVPCFQTNVKAPLADVTLPVTVVDGTGSAVTYSTATNYNNALAKQSNLDLLVKTFSTRANPVAISVSSTVSGDLDNETFTGYSNATAFGSTYNVAGTYYTVKFATEHTGLWNVSAVAESNENGYQLLTALNGVAITDLNTNIIAGDAFNTSSSSNDRNTLAIKNLVL